MFIFIVKKPSGTLMLHTAASTPDGAIRNAEIGSAKLKWAWFKEQGYTVQRFKCTEA